MNISERARKYLLTLKRDDNYVSDEKETKEYLSRHNIEPASEFLRQPNIFDRKQSTTSYLAF